MANKRNEVTRILPAKDESNKDPKAVQEALRVAGMRSIEALRGKGMSDDEIAEGILRLQDEPPDDDYLNAKSVLGFLIQSMESTWPPELLDIRKDSAKPSLFVTTPAVPGEWEITARRIR